MSNEPIKEEGLPEPLGGERGEVSKDTQVRIVVRTVDDLFKLLDEHKSQECTEWPKLIIELELAEPSLDPEHKVSGEVVGILNRAGHDAALKGGGDSEEAITPAAQTPDALDRARVTPLIEDAVRDDLVAQKAHDQERRAAIDHLLLAAGHSLAAIAEARDAAGKTVAEAEKRLMTSVLDLHGWIMRTAGEALIVWDSLHPDFRGLIVNLVASLIVIAVVGSA